MQVQKQAKKVSVVLVKSKQAETTSDINKMTIHLEKILEDLPGVDLKSKNSITEANARSADFIVFCGFSLNTLSYLFQCLSTVESTDSPLKSPLIILYDEPGMSIYEDLNRILMSGMDMRRVNPKIFKRLLDTWRHNDIINLVNQEIKKRENEPSEPDRSPRVDQVEPGESGEDPGA
jgi:hypothetical protein